MSTHIPYRDLDVHMRGLLRLQRARWTFFVSNKRGLLSGDELRTMMKITGLDWFREYGRSFTAYLAVTFILGLLAAMRTDLAVWIFVLHVAGTLGYLNWVNQTMDVLRVGDVDRLIPFLTITDSERIYLEAVAALANCQEVTGDQRRLVLKHLEGLLVNDRHIAALSAQRADLPTLEELSDERDQLVNTLSQTRDSEARTMLDKAVRIVGIREEHAAECSKTREQLNAARALNTQQLSEARDRLRFFSQDSAFDHDQFWKGLETEQIAHAVLDAVQQVRELRQEDHA